MKKEIHKQLRFTIGEQYENYEFQLSALGETIEDGICFEEYLYIGEEIQFFGIKVQKVKLYFNGDVLCAIHYIFDENLSPELLSNFRKIKNDEIDSYEFDNHYIKVIHKSYDNSSIIFKNNSYKFDFIK